MLLVKMKTMPGGTIIISKEFHKKAFTIIKSISNSTVQTACNHIVGILYKEGLLLKFTSFDKSIKNMIVSV